MRYMIFPFGKIRHGSNIVLYGVGVVAQEIYKQLLMTKYCNVIAWINKKYMMDIMGREIKNPSYVNDNKVKYDYVVVCEEDAEKCRFVRDELIRLYGIDEKKICIVDEKLTWGGYNSFEEMRHSKKMERLHFEVHLADHCNLNCKGCSHFSPLSDKGFVNLEELKNDFGRICAITKGDVRSIELLGGEPLLNPEIIEIVKVTRRYFQNTFIEIITNGLLLNQQSEDFFETCRENNIAIEITQYPINVNYESMKKIIEDHDVQLIWRNETNIEEKKFWKIKLDEAGRQNAEFSFGNCRWGGRTVCLNHGRLFPCCLIAYIHIFNKYFGRNFEVNDMDYVNIYDESIDEKLLLEKLNHTPDFCRYCLWEEGDNTYKESFGMSKKEISEWTK